MQIPEHEKHLQEIKDSFTQLNQHYVKLGCVVQHLEQECFPQIRNSIGFKIFIVCIVTVIFSIIYASNFFTLILNYLLGVRCVIPNNYFIWEATRPISDCNFCINVSEPIVLSNASRNEFTPYAYNSRPIVIKNAFLHWAAREKFDLKYFQDLYNQTQDSYKSVDEECQFLHFKSDFISISDVFAMSERRSQNHPSENSWYVGWGNCHPHILDEMRKYYPKPHFLPEDCEIPAKEYVFMGYDDGATLHLDFINRLMWQAQLKGSKTWHLVPPPECQKKCNDFSFLVQPGDAVLVDTRIWYHATTITPGEFSLSIQSEYG